MKKISFVRQAVKTFMITVFLFYSLSFAQVLKETEIVWKGKIRKVVKDEIGIKIKQKVNLTVLKTQIDFLGFTFADSMNELGVFKLRS